MIQTIQHPHANYEIELLIAEIQSEDEQFETTLRFTERDKLILPVGIRFLNGHHQISSFSRNISPAGISLISEQIIDPNSTAVLQIYRQENPSSEVVAICKWCKLFGRQYWISGWEFQRVPMH